MQPSLQLVSPVMDRERVIRMAEDLKRVDPVGFYFTVSDDIRVEVYRRAWARRAGDLDPDQVSSVTALSEHPRPGRAMADVIQRARGAR